MGKFGDYNQQHPLVHTTDSLGFLERLDPHALLQTAEHLGSFLLEHCVIQPAGRVMATGGAVVSFFRRDS